MATPRLTAYLTLLALTTASVAGLTTRAAASGDWLVAQAADINTAVANYQIAKAELQAARDAGGDTTEAQALFDGASAELAGLCDALGQPDLEACVTAVTGGSDMAEPAPAEEPAPAAESETALDEEPVSTEPAQSEEAAPVEPAPEEPADEPVAGPPPALIDAVARYEAANSALAAAVSENSDPSAPLTGAEAAFGDVGTLCGELGFADLSVCLDSFGLALSPLVEVPAMPEAEPETPPAGLTEPVVELEAESAPEATEPEATEAEPETAEPAASDEPAATEPVVEESAADEEPVIVNPSGTPMPRELAVAVSAYEGANRLLANSIAGTEQAVAAEAGVEARLDDLAALCAEAGAPDATTCLAAYGAALTPVAVPMTEADAATAAEAEVETIAPETEAPLLDSQKEALAEDPQAAEVPAAPAAGDQSPPPQSDAEAQAEAVPQTIESIAIEAGTALTTSAPPVRQRPADAQVVQQSGPRIVFNFNNRLFISNQADSRLNYGASETFMEELPRGRTRETIVRADGSSLVTVYNRFGDVLRRSRFDANGNETILAYVPEGYDDGQVEWQDPGRDLPPLWLGIPPEDYVLDADQADLDSVASFLDAPPVERVQRLYSIDEVKRSARLRDMVRRLEIGNLTFGFGEAGIPPDQIGALSIVANAMFELIDQNPAETFLIEGHTDAVGTDYANLILSDLRAYSVAIALTEVFGVPPENIATQGYGESYLKVKTEAPERANRRVTIRRITPLVSPTGAVVAGG